MKRDLVIFLVICTAMAGGTLVASCVRGELEKSAQYAKVITACLHGRGFSVPGRTVLCDPVEVVTGR